MLDHASQITDGTDDMIAEVRRDKYMLPNERHWSETLLRFARGIFPDDDVIRQQLLFELLDDGVISPAGRQLAGVGSGRQVTLINCFVMNDIEDSMRSENGIGIMDTLARSAYTMQMGGGIGMAFGTIRPKDADVSKIGASASGPLSFMDMWDSMCRTVMSAGYRRGAMMATLPCDHPDIFDFVEAKGDGKRLRMFNMSVLIYDDFMYAVRNNGPWALGHTKPPRDESSIVERTQRNGKPWYVWRVIRARDLWHAILRQTYVHAEPGVIFIDRVNSLSNLNYCENVTASNPCFTADTFVWTAEGHKTFGELAVSGKPVQVLTVNKHGRFIYRTMRRPRCTQRKVTVVEVVLSRPNGRNKHVQSTIRCTPSHEFYMRDGRRVPAAKLIPGDRIFSVYRSPRGKGYLGLNSHLGSLMEHHVPFEGVADLGIEIDAHHIDENKKNNRPGNLELIDHGQHSAEHKMGDRNPMRVHPEKNHFLTKDNRGRNNGRYRTDIDDFELKRMRSAGMSYDAIAKKVDASPYTVMKRLGWERPSNHVVKEVRILNVLEDVYCGTVDETHCFFVALGENDGVLVRNCAEQCLPPNGDCNLGHINLAQCVKNPFGGGGLDEPSPKWDWNLIERATRLMVRVLDHVVDLSLYPVTEQLEEAKAKRRVGLGITGLGNALQFLKLRYGSSDARVATRDVMRFIANTAYKESAQLAKEFGTFPMYKEAFLSSRFLMKLDPETIAAVTTHGVRNGMLLSVAPTGTNSIAQGDNCSGGVEPTFAHYFDRDVLQPDSSKKTFRVSDYGYRMFRKKFGEDAPLPDYMVTATELTAEEHVRMLAAAQEWVDNSISKTVNCPTSMTFEEFGNVYDLAYDLGCKSCATYRPDPASGRGSILKVVEDHTHISETTSSETTAPVDHNAWPKRPDELEGLTYKLRWPHIDEAVYLTVNDIDTPEGKRPFEVFLSTKAVRHAEWMTIFTRLVSAVFRKGGDVTFLVDEMRQVQSAEGGAFIGSRQYPSLVAYIGAKLGEHFARIGLIKPEQLSLQLAEECPKCGKNTFIRKEGCGECSDCHYSNCG